jgi:hypothetical protein
MSGHPLTCQRCGRPFTARRSDARYCSRSCRRRQVQEQVVTVVTTLADADELDGWRRVPGGYVIPPADPRNTIFLDPDPFGRL